MDESGQSPGNKKNAERHSHHRQHAVKHHDHMQGGTANAKAYEPHPSYPLEAGAKRAVDGKDGNRTADRGLNKMAVNVPGRSPIVRKSGRG